MRDLNRISEECKVELDALSIPYSKNSFIIKNTNKSAQEFGSTKKMLTKDTFSIRINPILLDDDVDINILKETILHELLHTVEGCMNHGKKWKEFVLKVNAAYGYNITTRASYEVMDKVNYYQKGKWKYIIKCEGCGALIYRNRKSNFTQNPGHYRCLKCGKAGCFKIIAEGFEECSKFLKDKK